MIREFIRNVILVRKFICKKNIYLQRNIFLYNKGMIYLVFFVRHGYTEVTLLIQQIIIKRK